MELWQGVVLKAAEADFPLISPGVVFTQDPRQRVKRVVEWEEPVEWRHLTAFHSPSVEQLRDRFIKLEMWGGEPVQRKEQPSRTESSQPSATFPALLP